MHNNYQRTDSPRLAQATNNAPSTAICPNIVQHTITPVPSTLMKAQIAHHDTEMQDFRAPINIRCPIAAVLALLQRAEDMSSEMGGETDPANGLACDTSDMLPYWGGRMFLLDASTETDIDHDRENNLPQNERRDESMDVDKGGRQMGEQEDYRSNDEASDDDDMECGNIYISQDESMDDDSPGEAPNGINKGCEPLTNSVTGCARETCTTDPIPTQNTPTSMTTEESLHALEEKYEALVKLCTEMPCPTMDNIRINITK